MGNEVKIGLPPKPTANSGQEEIEKLKRELMLFREETERRENMLRNSEQLIAEKQRAMRKELDSIEKEKRKWHSEKNDIESETKSLIKEKDRAFSELIEKQKAAKEIQLQKGNSDAETKKALKIIDNLLAKLPDDTIKKFAKSADFELYKRVLKKNGVN